MNYLDNSIDCTIESPAAIRKFKKGGIIYHQGDPAPFRFEVISGVVCTTYLFADGRRQLTGFFFVGDVFGADEEFHRASAEAVSETAEVLPIRWGDHDADERSLSKALELVENSILVLGRRTALSRVAAFLADVRVRTNGKARISLPMSRADVADYLGLTVETVSRTFSQLTRGRIIAQPEQHLVQIIDQERLNRLAGAGSAPAVPLVNQD